MMRMSTNAMPHWLAVRWGLCVPNWTKNLIMRAVNKIRPAALPSVAISSARWFSLIWRGVFSVSPRNAECFGMLEWHYEKGKAEMQRTYPS